MDKLIERIIPPDNYHHRNGFNNHPVIDELSEDDRVSLRKTLLKMLATGSWDYLVIETLIYLKATEAVSTFEKLLDAETDSGKRIILAAFIFLLNGDDRMPSIATDEFKSLRDKYSQIALFSFLSVFNDPLVDQVISEYINSSNFLISYNAKRAIEDRHVFLSYFTGKM